MLAHRLGERPPDPPDPSSRSVAVVAWAMQPTTGGGSDPRVIVPVPQAPRRKGGLHDELQRSFEQTAVGSFPARCWVPSSLLGCALETSLALAEHTCVPASQRTGVGQAAVLVWAAAVAGVDAGSLRP